MQMKAPNQPGLMYRATRVLPGAFVEVIEADVEALRAAGWSITLPEPEEKPKKSRRRLKATADEEK